MSTLSTRAKRTILVFAVGVGIWVLAGVVVSVKPDLLNVFKGDSAGTFSVSSNRLSEIVDQIRQHTRTDWHKNLTLMRDATARMEQYRDKLYREIARTKSDAILAEFKRLSENHHQRVQATDLRDPTVPKDYIEKLRQDGSVTVADLTTPDKAREDLEALMKAHPDRYFLVDAAQDGVSLGWIFIEFKHAEKRLTNAYRDIVGAKNLLKLEVPPIDAVSWVKVVPPDRTVLNQTELDHDVRSTTDGSLDRFKDNVKYGASEIDAMIKYARKMLEKAGLDDEDGKMEGWASINDQAFGSTQGETLLPDELSLDDSGGQDDDFGSVPGRYVGPKGQANRNIFIDKWYVIGPFENRFRSNLDSSFMPESVIDLENPTVGKDDKPIRWEYWRANRVRIEPSWAPRGCVYYGWTEIYVEEAGNYWMSMGSDDYGKLWVNGDLIWKSGTRPKSFKASEHTTEVPMKQGINEILFRCENHGGTMGWALILHNAAE